MYKTLFPLSFMVKHSLSLADSLKSSVGRKPVKRPSHYFIGRDMATARQQIPTVDKVRASLLPLSKSKYEQKQWEVST